MSAGSRVHFARVDAARARRELIARADATGEYVYLTDEELAEWRAANGYLPGGQGRGEGMGEE